jgi:hypothetical protein
MGLFWALPAMKRRIDISNIFGFVLESFLEALGFQRQIKMDLVSIFAILGSKFEPFLIQSGLELC